MKPIPHSPSRPRVRVGACLAALAGGLAAGLAPAHAAPPSLQPLVHPGKWPTWSRGDARDVKAVGNYAYVALYQGGLGVFDVSNPANCVQLGGYHTREPAWAVAVSRNYAYVADGFMGLLVFDVRNPINCVRVGGHATSGFARGVTVVADRIYVADFETGLAVLPTLPNLQFTVRVDATPGAPFTLEVATNLNAPIPWTPLLTTNVPVMPFDYVDFDVKFSDQPRKYYRVRQP